MTAPDAYIFVIQVYVPCKNHPMSVYNGYLEELENIAFKYNDKGTLIILGDFNTELPSERCINTILGSRGAQLLDIANRHNLKSLNTMSFCQGSKFSNVPFNTNRETLIDHIFVSKMALDCFTYCEILEDHATNVSTHRPIICKLSIPKNSEVLRLALELPIVSTSDIDNLYSGIAVIINLATDLFIPRVKFKPHIKPYWN
ncbi:hypothetical protein MAR_011474, partial [Mya arenaria]